MNPLNTLLRNNHGLELTDEQREVALVTARLRLLTLPEVKLILERLQAAEISEMKRLVAAQRCPTCFAAK